VEKPVSSNDAVVIPAKSAINAQFIACLTRFIPTLPKYTAIEPLPRIYGISGTRRQGAIR
jgi:hypothetical protein